MPQHPVQLPSAVASKAEKLSVLSALLGPEALAKLREGQPEASQILGATVEVDADRAAWHRNKLLERLRVRSGNAQSASTQPKRASFDDHEAEIKATPQNGSVKTPKMAASVLDAARRSGGLDTRLAAIADPETLDQEHPAIIACLMKGLSREERIIALKSLPGPIARSIVRRLK